MARRNVVVILAILTFCVVMLIMSAVVSEIKSEASAAEQIKTPPAYPRYMVAYGDVGYMILDMHTGNFKVFAFVYKGRGRTEIYSRHSGNVDD